MQPMEPTSTPFPAGFTFDAPETGNWRPLVLRLFVIPHLVVVHVLGLVSDIIGLVSWFIVLFAGSLPDGLANLQAMYRHSSIRAHTYTAFLVDDYPPFALA
jgi:Domain of unknown function (DUF4389)